MNRHYLRLMRPTDWVKNVFIFPALVFSGELTNPELFGRTVIAFIAFCLAASGFYALNDVLDAEKDRSHPVKRKRPVASGAIPPTSAVAFGAALLAVGLGTGLLVHVDLLLVLVIYALLQAAYNLKLKRVMFVDVTVLAIGFALRAAAGAIAIEVALSPWLLLCVFFLTLYLGFIKRLCDIASAETDLQGQPAGNPHTLSQQSAQRWISPAGYTDRLEMNWLLGISAALAVVTYLMYALSDHTYELFGARSIGFALMSPLVLIAVQRFYHRASTGESDSPFSALTRDRAVICCVVLFAAGTLVLLYVPGIEARIAELFLIRPLEQGQ